MAKIKIDSALFDRLKQVTQSQGYSSVDEYVTHLIESELAKHESQQENDQVADQLRGLGYIE